MTRTSKREKLIEKIDAHLRHTARHLVKFDSLNETLQYIIDSFWLELPCDFVGIIMRDHEQLIPKIWKGGSDQFTSYFPICLEHCSPNILEKGWDVEKNEADINCDFHRLMKKEHISTWFTIPLKVEDVSMGFCIIGFHNFVPLIAETEQIFVEFGKDIAMAIGFAQNKEVHRKKIQSIKWFNEQLSPGSSVEQLVERIVELASQGTNAERVCVYLYDERTNSFVFQRPSYGTNSMPELIKVLDKNRMDDYFPYFEKINQKELTIPLIVNLKTIGILHVAQKITGNFTSEDYEILDFLSQHVSALLENARLYKMETDLKNRLQTAIGYQQELVKQTLANESFANITTTLSSLLSQTILLLDCFLRPISYHIVDDDESFILEKIVQMIQEQKEFIHSVSKRGIWMEETGIGEKQIGIWPVSGSGELLGYLVLPIKKEELDDVQRLTIENALNVYAIQFIKQKLVADTKEQVKESFINQLFEEKITDLDKIIESANLFHWNLFDSHRIATLSIDLVTNQTSTASLIDLEASKAQIWQKIKDSIVSFDPLLLLTRKKSELILIIPVKNESKNQHKYWERLYQFIDSIVFYPEEKIKIHIGIGGNTTKISDYFICYNQAILAQNVAKRRMNGEGFAFYDNLGVYTLLHNIKEPTIATLFIKKHLELLLQHSKGKGADLFTTLRVYLFHNGNWKHTMDDLFIHRSTLRYRLDRIKDILDVDLDNAEVRLNLMIAYKLHDLFME